MFVLRLALICFIATVFAEENKKQPPVEILTEKSFVRQDGYNFIPLAILDHPDRESALNSEYQWQYKGEMQPVMGTFGSDQSLDLVDIYKTSDGVSREEEGQLIEVGEHKGIGVKGSYSYVGPDGLHYRVTFVADDKGYRPELHIDHPQN